MQKALQMTKSAMESRIAEIDEEKASAVQAVTNEMVQVSREAGKQKVGGVGCHQVLSSQSCCANILDECYLL